MMQQHRSIDQATVGQPKGAWARGPPKICDSPPGEVVFDPPCYHGNNYDDFQRGASNSVECLTERKSSSSREEQGADTPPRTSLPPNTHGDNNGGDDDGSCYGSDRLSDGELVQTDLEMGDCRWSAEDRDVGDGAVSPPPSSASSSCGYSSPAAAGPRPPTPPHQSTGTLETIPSTAMVNLQPEPELRKTSSSNVSSSSAPRMATTLRKSVSFGTLSVLRTCDRDASPVPGGGPERQSITDRPQPTRDGECNHQTAAALHFPPTVRRVFGPRGH
eukprot:COSAG01_NODE_49_length_31891_cov_29.945773_24_plen_274_part_00